MLLVIDRVDTSVIFQNLSSGTKNVTIMSIPYSGCEIDEINRNFPKILSDRNHFH